MGSGRCRVLPIMRRFTERPATATRGPQETRMRPIDLGLCAIASYFPAVAQSPGRRLFFLQDRFLLRKKKPASHE